MLLSARISSWHFPTYSVLGCGFPDASGFDELSVGFFISFHTSAVIRRAEVQMVGCLGA